MASGGHTTVTVPVLSTLFAVCEPTRTTNDSPDHRVTTARTCGPLLDEPLDEPLDDVVSTYAKGRRATAPATCVGSIRTLTSRNYQALPCLPTLAP